jgi:hypothetical protein
MIYLGLAVLLILIAVALYRVWPKKALGPFPSDSSERVGYILRVFHRVLSIAGFAILLAGITMLIARGARDLLG